MIRGGFQLTQKQCLIANGMALIPNDAIFIKTNMKIGNLKIKKNFTQEEIQTVHEPYSAQMYNRHRNME